LDGPTSIITGDFTVSETQELALLISGAALPAGVTILSTDIRKEQAPQSKKLLISLLAFVIGAAATFFILNSLKST
jgi:preprotein translocase subunit SecD